jgi:hypothetical protein
MSELTRDEIIECTLDCPNSILLITRDTLRSLRDDYNAEVEKNKLLEAEVERLKSAIQTYNATPENTVVVPRIGDTLYYITVWNTHQIEEKNQGKINAIKIFENIIVVCIDDSRLEFDLKKQHMTWFLDRDEWEKASEIVYNMKKCLSELSCQYCGQSNTMRIVCGSVQCSSCGKNIN